MASSGRLNWFNRGNLNTNTLFTVSEPLSEPRSFFTPPLYDLLKFAKQRMPIRSRSKILVARISREFLSCLGTAFRSCLGTLPPRLRLRHITILAEGLARHPALLPQIGPGLSLEDAYLFDRLRETCSETSCDKCFGRTACFGFYASAITASVTSTENQWTRCATHSWRQRSVTERAITKTDCTVAR